MTGKCRTEIAKAMAAYHQIRIICNTAAFCLISGVEMNDHFMLQTNMNHKRGLTKESVGSSISVFMFRLLFPCLLRLLANVDGQPRTYHAINGIHTEEITKRP